MCRHEGRAVIEVGVGWLHESVELSGFMKEEHCVKGEARVFSSELPFPQQETVYLMTQESTGEMGGPRSAEPCGRFPGPDPMGPGCGWSPRVPFERDARSHVKS